MGSTPLYASSAAERQPLLGVRCQLAALRSICCRTPDQARRGAGHTAAPEKSELEERMDTENDDNDIYDVSEHG